MESRVARCGALTWATSAPAGGAVAFSLRPESLRLLHRLEDAPPGSDGLGAAGGTSVVFAGRVRRQVFGGATDLLEVECADGQVLLARIPGRGEIDGRWAFEFDAADAVPLNDEA